MYYIYVVILLNTNTKEADRGRERVIRRGQGSCTSEHDEAELRRKRDIFSVSLPHHH
jgi:hypothetical protein